jgi:ABC-type cobalt transport system substrate-binding protein
VELSVLLAILASSIHLCGYAVYNTAALKGAKKPNLVPWTIWGVMAILNTITYGLMTGDGIKAMLSAAGTVAAIATFIVALVKGGSFKGLNKTNRNALIIGLLSVVAWKFGSPAIANYFVLAAVISGFIPFYQSLWADPSAEAQLPWLLWSISTALGVVVVALRFSGNYSDFVAPVVSMVLHVTTWLLTFRKK